MRAIVKYDHPQRHLHLWIHQAHHRRMGKDNPRVDQALLRTYRRALWEGAAAAGIVQTLTHQIYLSAVFIDPCGPDLDNLIVALFRALDGKTGRGPTILADDKQIIRLKDVYILPLP